MITLLQITLSILASYLFMIGSIKVLKKISFKVIVTISCTIIIYCYYIVFVEANILNLF